MGKEFERGGRGGGRGGSRGGRGGRGGGRGGKPGLGRGPTTTIVAHRHGGIFIAKGKEDLLVTKNMVPGESVYGEKRVSVEEGDKNPDGSNIKTEYRVWNAFRSKLGACIVNGVNNIYMQPGSKVLYLGAANGTTVSHVSDLVGPVN